MPIARSPPARARPRRRRRPPRRRRGRFPGTHPCRSTSLATTSVQTRKPAPTTAAAGARRDAARRARSRSSPSVRSVRNTAPWSAKRRQTATPARTEYTLNRSPKSPAKVWSEAIGTPWRRLASAMPQRNGAPTDPIVFSQAQNAFQRGDSALLAPLEREHAHDQEREDEEEGEVEAREHRRVPDREGGERRAAGDHEPDLVPVPDRPDRLEHRRAVALAPAEDGQEHADAEVEALEHEVARPEEREQAEPEDLERHLSTPAPAPAPPPRLRRPGLGRVEPGVAAHEEEVDRRRAPRTATRTRPG